MKELKRKMTIKIVVNVHKKETLNQMLLIETRSVTVSIHA